MIIRENIKKPVLKAEDIYKIIASLLDEETIEEKEREHFYVFGLDAKNKVRYLDLCSLGTATKALIHPRGVFRLAILKGCVSIACAYPSFRRY